MTSEWGEVAVEKLLAVPLRNGLNRPTAVRGEGTKMLNMGELFAHPRIRNVPMERVPLSETEAQAYLLEPGDLLFARQSLVLSGAGKCSVFLGASEPVTYEGHIIRARLNKDVGDPLFYYYLFASRIGRDAIESIVEQVAAAGIRGSDLARLKVPYPPLAEQRTIAHIPGSLDDKIELDRQMKETLEKIAQAIFKSWFVDFDLVRAKAEGHQLVGVDVETVALFPESLGDSPLGEIPTGWRVGRVSDLAQMKRKSVSPDAFPGEPFHHYSVPAYDEGRVPKTDPGAAIASGKYEVPAGAVLICKLNPRFPRVWLPTVDGQGRSVCSTEFFPVIARSGFSREYLYALFSSLSFLRPFAALVTGTSSSHQRVRPKDFLGMPVVLPDVNVVAKFTEIVKPLLQRVAHNGAESVTLAATRDALLLKLMSGEIRVKDAECFAEARP